MMYHRPKNKFEELRQYICEDWKFLACMVVVSVAPVLVLVMYYNHIFLR